MLQILAKMNGPTSEEEVHLSEQHTNQILLVKYLQRTSKTLNPSWDIRVQREYWSSFVISVAKKFNRHLQESSNESSQEQTERSNRKMELKFGFANLIILHVDKSMLKITKNWRHTYLHKIQKHNSLQHIQRQKLLFYTSWSDCRHHPPFLANVFQCPPM
jgi:hypothetical protein